MRQEVILAIIIGLVLGLIITFGVYTANKSVNQSNNPPVKPTPVSATPSPSTKNDLVTISSPSDGDLIYTASATISGQIQENTQLIILSENEDLVVTPNEDLSFSQVVKLISGANLITITAIQGDQKQEIFLNLVYTTTKYE